MNTGNEDKCIYCGSQKDVKNCVCSNCRAKITTVRRFLKEARALRERLDKLEAAELKERRLKDGR